MKLLQTAGSNGKAMPPQTADGHSVKLENVPVIVQPGQVVGTVGLALGYGRKAVLKRRNGSRFKCFTNI